MPEEFEVVDVGFRPGIIEYSVVITPVIPLKYIRVNVVLNKPVKLKTRFQILKECS